MFETKEFRAGLENAARDAVREMRLLKYQPPIVDILQFLAMANEEHLLRIESGRPTAQRRGVQQAITSAQKLTLTAGKVAVDRHSTELQIADLSKAYAVSFCQVWPFCR